MLGLTLADCISLVLPMTQADPRDRALAWLAQAPAPASVGFAAQPWFQAPPLSPYFSLPKPGGWRQFAPPVTPTRLDSNGRQWSVTAPGSDWDLSVLTHSPPHYILLSEYDYQDALRLHDPQARAFLGTLDRAYRRAAVFSGPAPLFTLRRLRGERPTQGLPHDMLYPDPTTLIYEQRK